MSILVALLMQAASSNGRTRSANSRWQGQGGQRPEEPDADFLSRWEERADPYETYEAREHRVRLGPGRYMGSLPNENADEAIARRKRFAHIPGDPTYNPKYPT